MTKKNSGVNISGVHPYQISPLIRVRESARSGLRQFLLYVVACSLLVAVGSGTLTSHLSADALPVVLLTSFLLGVPLALFVWVAVRILRFAFNR
ncbi:MAG TPA: hypothetical protein VKQ28_05235 [Candidatus Acidoferrum sp.]|nr:hypothetical protein [Candidatus Acidoferrum sp.]